MKQKKILAVCMATALVAGSAFSALGCTATEDLIKDGKTINVKLHSAGYGTSYIYALQEKFEAAFADEGYKLNIFTPKAGFSGVAMVQDIATDAGADLYIGGGVTQVMLKEYDNTVADITELVANQKPIGFNGEEVGDKTIAEILNDCNYGYNCLQREDGSWYAIPWNSGVRGLAVNMKVLEAYDLEIPKTTKELFACFDKIMVEAAETAIFPITQIATTNNYPVSASSGWMAQYEGVDWYNELYTFQKADGTKLDKTTAIEMFNADGVKYMFENFYRIMDLNVATNGSNTQGVEKAQAKFMNGQCAFMLNGDWMLQETYSQFSDKERENITFARVPMISELGVKLFGAGTSYNKSEEDCEKILRAIIDEADANKELADIKTAVDAKFGDIKLEDVKRVAEARGYTYPESVASGMYISARSEVKDIVALFLRMCASPEGGQLLSAKTFASNPYVTEYEESHYPWVTAARDIVSSRYFKGVRSDISGYRATIDPNFLDIFPLTGTYVNAKVAEQKISMYDSDSFAKVGSVEVYKTAAAAMQKSIYEDVRDNYNNKW